MSGCPTCTAEGRTSTVTEAGVEETCMGWFRFRDEAGRLHSHNPNRQTAHLVCSNGHHFAEDRGVPPCEVCELVKAGVI